MSMFELTQRGRVAVLRMTHGKANAIDLEFIDGLAEQLDACRHSPAGALVITGQGKMFSAGVDLPRLVAGRAPHPRPFLPPRNDVFSRLLAVPPPRVRGLTSPPAARR